MKNQLSVAIATFLALGISGRVQAQNLFVPGFANNTITEITPGGAQSTFASGLDDPWGLAFNSEGDLFEADADSGNIYEFTPGGVQSTFASVVEGNPSEFAFQPVPEPSVWAILGIGILVALGPRLGRKVDA